MSAAPTYEFPGGGSVPLPVRYTLGLDLGKVSDFSALAIVEERPERCVEQFGQMTITPVWGDDPDYALPWLQRWPLQTAYHDIARDVATLVAQLVGPTQTEVSLFVDGTGVGTAVVEILLAQDPILDLTYRDAFKAVTITAGGQTTNESQYTPNRQHYYRNYHVPKKELVGAAQMALQRQKLTVAPSLPEAAVLAEELRNFEYRITESANTTFNARQGQHDDLVLATAIALWGSRQRPAYLQISRYVGKADVPPYGNGVKPYGRLRIG